ncbi:poly [ADP-ribose] polymerase tankyrase-like [Antedon mediterranea]|uniref:poly [ADP-ribose] polymerase tankyrase-like n=1 Tax=Antedon mediterranea TaxID=105859 RepID=UPI003AF4F12C
MADEDSQLTPPKKRGAGSPGRSPERKRKRVQAEYYQSDVVDVFSRTSAARTPTATKQVFFDKGAFLAVRGPEEPPFYICQTNQNVFTSSKSVKIRWLEIKKSPDLYILSYNDTVDLESVLTEVKLTKKDKNSFIIATKEIKRVEKIIDLAIKKENGELNEKDVVLNKDLLPDDDDEEDEDEEEEKKKPVKKRNARKAPAKKKAGAKSRAALKPKPKASVSLVSDRLKNKARQRLSTLKQNKTKSKAKLTKSKAKKPLKKKVKKVVKKVKEKKKKEPKTKKHPNQLLTPNTKIEVVMKDPCFEIKAENEMPEVSHVVYAKRAIRAVLTNDMALLRRLIDETKKVSTLFLARSVNVEDDAMSYAIMNNNHAAIKLLGKEIVAVDKDSARRCDVPDSILESQGTGRYDFNTFGHATRSISMSRGSKEGNNAFTKEKHQVQESFVLGRKYTELALKCGASKATVDILCAVFPDCQSDFNMYITKGVREGNRKVPAYFIQQSVKAGGCGFNFLHHEVLTASHPDELTKFKAVSVKKKPYDNDCATPLHFAAVNPNPKILAKLLDSLPEYSLPDKTNRKPIHYAAACEGSGPLELLLNKSANPEETDNQGTTPLMIAAQTGRTQNIEILMRKIKANNPGEKSGLHRRGPAGKTPLHFAAQNGHTDAVKALIKHGADIEAILNAGNNKETVLMQACKFGHFGTVKALVELNAIIEKKDKLQKTALMHAVINGHYKIVCFLLRKGASPNSKDSSGNTLVHYAAAYGWWYCLRVLLKAGGSANTPNDWKIPPLGIAIMTGNRGCADLLLEQDEVDINFKDDNGYTLVTYLVTAPLSSNVMEDLKHLVEDLKARVDQTDVKGWTALHHLTEHDVVSPPHGHLYRTPVQTRQAISLKLAEMLLKYGCPLSAKTDDGKTAVNLAIEQEKCNIELIQLLVKKGCTISLSTNKEKETILHTMVDKCKQNDVSSLIQILGDRLQTNSEDATDGDGSEDKVDGVGGGMSIQSIAKQVDKNGLTPLTKCVYDYYQFRNSRMEDETIKSFSNMVKALVDIGSSDVNQAIQPQDVVDGRDETDEPLKYKQSPIQMLAACNERSNKDGGQTLINLLLSFKPGLDRKDGKGRTPLIIAILNDNVEAAKLLIKHGANIKIASDDLEDDGKATPLVLAARCNQLDLMHTLLSKGASVTDIDEKNKKTALHYVASSSKTASEVVSIVKALLKKKAQINAMDEHKRTPLHLAVNANEGGTNATAEVVEILLENNANVFAKDADDCLPLHYAFSKINKLSDHSQMDPIEMATTIIESMKRSQINSQNIRGQTPLHLAAYRGASISAMYIVERIQNYEVRDKFGNTPLATAMIGGYDSMCIMLIQKGANINIDVTEVTDEMLIPPKKDKAEKTKKYWQWKPTKTPPDTPTTMPFFRSALEKNWQGVCYLVMDRLDKFMMSYTQAVQCAFEAFKYQMALTMIRKQKESQRLTALNNKGQNLLHLLCLNAPKDESTDLQVQVADMLGKRGLNFFRKDSYSCTAITYAAASQNNSLIDFFFNSDNDQFETSISTPDSIGRLPMAALFYNPIFDDNTHNLIKLFLKCGGSLNIRSPVPYVEPALAKFLPQPKSLSEVFHGASERNIDQTPLILCIRNGLFKAVDFLLKNGADPNYPDKDMVTPLMHAVKKNDVDIVKLLLNHSYVIKKKAEIIRGFQLNYSKLSYLNWGRKKGKQPRARGFQQNVFRNNYNDSDDEDGNSSEEEMDDDDEDNDNEDEEMDVDDEEDEEGKDDEEADEDMENGIDEEKKENGKTDAKKSKKSKKKTEDFKMTSNVNLNATDSKARNVIHHVVHSNEEGTYQNVQMLELLVSVGASLDQKDVNGKTPLDYAMNVRSTEMTAAIQTLKKVAEKNRVKPEALKVKWSDNIQWQGESPDFQEDSKKMLQKLEEEIRGDDPDDKPSAQVDDNSGLTEGGVVLIDPELNIPYNAVMTKVEVRYGLQGMNNFYKLQVIHQKGKDVYALFTRWGMIGQSGQFQCTPFSTKEEAVKEFLKVFRSKTGNSWSNVKNFEKQPKKYRLVNADPLKSKRVYKGEKNPSFSSKIVSKLPSRVIDVMKSLTNHKMYEASMRGINIDTSYLPTSMISRDVLMKAKKILTKVSENLKECNRLRDENLLQEIEKFQSLMDEINDLSNEYYELIPHIDFSYQNISPLTDENTLKEAVELITNLLDYEVASKVILGARFKQQEVNPLDYVYRTLDCQLQLLNEESGEAQRILRYIHNTQAHGNVSIEGIFRLNRSGEEERLYNKGVSNHMLLWHGTQSANLISILKKGLLVAPPEAPSTGYMFGKGIYFADTFTKSSGYCHSRGEEDSKWMLLCEVALGKSCTISNYYEFDETKHTKNNDSVCGKGRSYPNPMETIHLPQGAKIPLGEMHDESNYYNLNHNEFIVYDSSQVCLRYLVQFKDA